MKFQGKECLHSLEGDQVRKYLNKQDTAIVQDAPVSAEKAGPCHCEATLS